MELKVVLNSMSSADDLAWQRFRQLNARIGTLKAVSYDICAACNLRCEGCLFFEGEEGGFLQDDRSLAEWEARFAADAERGVNLAYIAGAEPGLVPDRIRAAQKYFPYGIVFSNGTVRLPDDITFRIHISAWGIDEVGASLRAGDVLRKALNNYRGDPRAVLAFTISASNIDQIQAVCEMANQNDLPLTFSYFSPTTRYLEKLQTGAPNDKGYFRISGEESSLVMTRQDYDAARREIVRAMEAYPQTIQYSLAYDDWVTSDQLYNIDPESGIALDCGVRTSEQQHVRVDLSGAGKCCSSNIDCSGCRAYAMAHTTYFARLGKVRRTPGGLASWVEVREIWSRLFLPPGITQNSDPDE